MEELAEQGQDLARLVTDLLEHLRHLLLVQHMGEPPDSLPVTEETRERLQAQANQLGASEVLRLIDLLALAVDEIREGGDPRLPLELALVKVTRPQADLSREAVLLRLEQLEARTRSAPPPPPSALDTASDGNAPGALTRLRPRSPRQPPTLRATSSSWRTSSRRGARRCCPRCRSGRSPWPRCSARPSRSISQASGSIIEFPPFASFHRNLAEEPKNSALLSDVLHEITGHRLAPAFTDRRSRARRGGSGGRRPDLRGGLRLSLKDTLDAREVEEPAP